MYYWLGDIVQSIIPSVHDCCFSSNTHLHLREQAIAFLYYSHLQGMHVGTESIDASIHLLSSSSSRNVGHLGKQYESTSLLLEPICMT